MLDFSKLLGTITSIKDQDNAQLDSIQPFIESPLSNIDVNEIKKKLGTGDVDINDPAFQRMVDMYKQYPNLEIMPSPDANYVRMQQMAKSIATGKAYGPKRMGELPRYELNPGMNNKPTIGEDKVNEIKNKLNGIRNNKDNVDASYTPQTNYFNQINEGLNKIGGVKGLLSPANQKKLAQLYTKARNKYKTSSKSEEETNAFNAIRNNPIWKKFNK